jgi:hypothetical protein
MPVGCQRTNPDDGVDLGSFARSYVELDNSVDFSEIRGLDEMRGMGKGVADNVQISTRRS